MIKKVALTASAGLVSAVCVSTAFGLFLYQSPVLLATLSSVVSIIFVLSILKIFFGNRENRIVRIIKNDYVLNNIRDGLVLITSGGIITYANTSALFIYKFKRGIVSKRIEQIFDYEPLVSVITDCINGAEGCGLEIKINGFYYDAKISRLPDTRVPYVMVVFTDITESRESGKRREEFFQHASHELKTPLTAIKGFNDLVYLKNKNMDLDKYIDGISREANRMNTLISDMMKFSELETKTINSEEYTGKGILISTIISEVLDAMADQIFQKRLDIKTYGDAVIRAHARHLYDLVKNLLENAVRYNVENGRVTIDVSKEDKFTKFVVSDAGIGIPLIHHTRIFERFYRVEKSRSTQSGGPGLGLAIVKHICKVYGWEVSLESEEGVGTEITVLMRERE